MRVCVEREREVAKHYEEKFIEERVECVFFTEEVHEQSKSGTSWCVTIYFK